MDFSVKNIKKNIKVINKFIYKGNKNKEWVKLH
jgi:hypothetical protein